MRTQKFGTLLTVAQIIIVGVTLSLPAPAQEPFILPPSSEQAVMTAPPAPETKGFFARAEHIIGAVWSEIARPPLAWFDGTTLAAGALIILIGRWKSWRESAGGKFNSDKLRPFAQFALCLLSLFAAVYLAYLLNPTDEFFIIGGMEFNQTQREDFSAFFNTGQQASFGLDLARGFLDFSVLILTLLGALLSVGMRLASPIVIALALNRQIPGMRLCRHGWGVFVSSVIWPILSVLLCVSAYLSRDAAMYIREITPGGEVIAVIAIVFTGLLLLAIPKIFYKLVVGRVYESVSATIAASIIALAYLSNRRRRSKL